MKKFKKSALTIYFVICCCLMTENCIDGQNNRVGNQNALENRQSSAPISNRAFAAPVIEITAAAAQNNVRQPLKIHWKITNPGSESIYIYSSLLKSENNGFVEFKPDVARKTLEILFTHLEKIPVEPNYFPASEFQEVSAGEMLEGDFTTRYTLLEAINDSRSEPAVKAFKIAGQWNISALFGYGTETESVKQKIAQLKDGHPINPIVEWQKVVASPEIKINLK